MRVTRLQESRYGAVIAVVVAALLGGCAGDEPPSGSSSKEAASGPVDGTLSVWMFQPEEGENWWPGFVERFEKKYPRANVEITTYPSEDYYTKLQTAMSAGDEPDLYWSNAGEVFNRFIRAGRLAPIEEIVDLDRWAPASLAPFTSDDSTYAAPAIFHVLVMWLNRDLIAEHDVAVPETWSDLLTACRTLSADGVIPIALGNRGADAWTAGVLFDTLLVQYGGPKASINATFGRAGASWSDPAFVQAATRLKELVDANCFPRGFTGLSYAQMGALFTSGKAAMAFDGSWVSGTLKVAKADFEADVIPLPDAPGASHSTTELEGIVGGEDGFAVTARGIERNGAAIAAFLNEYGSAVDDYARFYGYLSVSAEPKPQSDRLSRKLTEMLASAENIVTDTPSAVPTALQDDFFQTTQALTAGELQPEEFANEMAEATERERSKFDTEG